MRPLSLIWSFAAGNWQRTVDGRNLACVLGALLAAFIAAATAAADTAVVGLSPKVARPGDQVDLRIGRGACPADATFPISLVPVAKAPRPYPCRDNALCTPTAPAPPRQRPFVFPAALAVQTSARPDGAATWFGLAPSLYRPEIEPGVYAFAIFAVSRQGPPGVLIADTGPGHLLRILPRETPVGSSGDGSDATLWIVAGIGTIALVLAAVLCCPPFWAASIVRLTATALDEKPHPSARY